MGRKRTENEIKEIVENLGYIYIRDYCVDKKPRKVIIQDKHGYKYDVQLPNVLRGGGINFVDKGNPFSLENISLWLKLNNNQFKLLENNEYINSHSKLYFYCNICKDYPKMSWSDVLQRKGCGVCHGLQTGQNHNLEFQKPDIAKEWHPTLNGKLTPKDFTRASNQKVWWLCSNGHSYFSKILHRTISLSGCKECSDAQQESKLASEIKSYFLSRYNSKDEYMILKNPKTNYYLPYDMYIFGGKNIYINGIYIEIHGEQHYRVNSWHNRQSKRKETTPEEEFEYQKYKDEIKKKFAKKHGTYIEVNIRKIKTTEEAIEYIERIIEKTLSN